MTTVERIKAMNQARDKAKSIRERYACPQCSSTNTLARMSGIMFCRRCGHEWDTPRKEMKV